MLPPLKWLFYIPPVEQRPKRDGIARVFIFAEYNRNSREAYIFYKAFMINLCLNAIFFSLFLLSFLSKQNISLGPLVIAYRPDAAVDELVYNYPHHIFPILAAVTVVYVLLMIVTKTDFFSLQSIRSGKLPAGFESKQVNETNPLWFIFGLLFFSYCGYAFQALPYYFRHYQMYNYVHDFRAHSLSNFLIFMAGYAFFYQTVFYLLFAIGPIYLIRNTIRVIITGKTSKTNKEEHDDRHN